MPAAVQQIRVVKPLDTWWGELRRTRPFCRKFGYSRGKPVDRYYIEAFLAGHAGDIRGRVLEVGDASYTRRFGGAAVDRADVLQHPPGDARGTFIGDLASGAGLPDDAFDCIILTQVLECICDCRAALRHVFRALRPGGVLLLTGGCLSRISTYDMQRWGDFWRFTPQSLQGLLCECTEPGLVMVRSRGNAVAATAFLFGLAQHELTPLELERQEECAPLIVTARAAKPQARRESRS